MLKKSLILATLLLFAVSVQADTHLCIGGQVTPRGGDTEGWGGGFMLAGIQKISPNLYVWGEYEAFKTKEGISVDNGTAEVCLVTNVLIPSLKAHYYAKPGIGITKREGEKAMTGKQFTMGFVFDVSKETMLWLGSGYSDNAGLRTWSLEAALSWDIDWK